MSHDQQSQRISSSILQDSAQYKNIMVNVQSCLTKSKQKSYNHVLVLDQLQTNSQKRTNDPQKQTNYQPQTKSQKPRNNEPQTQEANREKVQKIEYPKIIGISKENCIINEAQQYQYKKYKQILKLKQQYSKKIQQLTVQKCQDEKKIFLEINQKRSLKIAQQDENKMRKIQLIFQSYINVSQNSFNRLELIKQLTEKRIQQTELDKNYNIQKEFQGLNLVQKKLINCIENVYNTKMQHLTLKIIQLQKKQQKFKQILKKTK